jgi:hypothetical protein
MRIRTRLRVSVMDETVLCEIGEHLGRLAGQDLAERCRLGLGDAHWSRRKRGLTAASSSRWAGTISRTSEIQWQRAYRNLLDQRAGLRRAIRRLRARLAAPIGARADGVHGYANGAERWEKQRRLDLLSAQLARVEARIAQGRVSVVRGGRRLFHTRQHLEAAGLTELQWRRRWEADRWFLAADGDAEYPFGNGTILVHPEEGWLELKLPAPLAHLANRPTAATGCPAPSTSPTELTTGRPRWAPGRSATISATTRSGTAGTWMHRGRTLTARSLRWRSWRASPGWQSI